MSEPVPPQALQQQADFVRALARRLVGDEHIADDVEQEAWLRALERPRPLGNLRAWLAAVTRNLATRVHRSAGRRAAREAEAARPEAVASTAEREAALRSVLEAVLALEEPYKTAILLRYYEGLPAAEVAARTGAPLATVRSRLQRGVARLRERLDREHGGDRSSWCAGLVASLGLEGTGGTVGVVIMAGKLKMAIAASICVVGGVGLWRALPSHPASPEAEARVARQAEPELVAATGAEQDVPDVAAPAGVAEERAPVPAAEPPPPAEETFELRGRVVDRHGAPVPTATVFLGIAIPDGHGDVRSALLPVDEEGWYTAEYPLGHLNLYARAPGYSPSRAIMRDHVPDTVLPTLVLPGAGSGVAGLVLDPDGVPVAGAAVEIYEERKILVGEEGTRGQLEFPYVHHTDDAGRFAADGLFPGSNELVVKTDAFPDRRVLAAVKPGETRDVVVRLERGEEIRGTITDDTGRPAPGVALTLTNPMKWGQYEVSHALDARTDEDGTFAIENAAPGEVEIWARHKSLGNAYAKLVVERGRTTWWDPQLERELVLRGRVVDGEGEPIAGWRVVAQGRPEDNLVYWKERRTTDEEGRFAMPNCPEKPLRVQICEPNRSDAPVLVALETVLPGQPEVVFTITEALVDYADVTGILLDHAGEPFAEQMVFLARDEAHTMAKPAEVDAETGAFRFESMPPATYVLSGWLGRYGFLRLRELDVEPGQDLDLGEIRTQPPGGLVATVIRSEDLGEATPEFTIYGEGSLSGIAHTSRGEMPARLELHPGDYVLSARGTSILPASVRFAIRADKDTHVELRLERGTMRGLQFFEPENAVPGQSVKVVVRDLATGEVELEREYGRGYRDHLGGGLPLDPGDWKLEAVTDTGLRYELELHLTADEKVEVAVEALVDG